MKTAKFMLIEVLYFIPILIFTGIVFKGILDLNSNSSASYVTAAVMFMIATYLTLLTVRKKLIPGDLKRLTKNVSLAYLIIALVSIFLADGALIQMMYAILSLIGIPAFGKLLKIS